MNRIPGIVLCIVIALVARAIQSVQLSLYGVAWLEGVVLAILLGALVRSVFTLDARFQAGIEFSARTVLEIAVAMLGLSLSAQALASMGAPLIASIVAIVAVGILASYTIGRALGLSKRLATLIACGNAICGNSAIAAVAPVIGADADDVASAISFTAILGVIVVITLPLFIPVLHLSNAQYGTLAGLTVYAVPQVLAATVPVSALSAQVGTLVKLVRVLMLGPVVLVLSVRNRVQSAERDRGVVRTVARLVPWFIIVFLLLVVVRASGQIPQNVITASATATNYLTIVAMAALGLGVDVRALAKVGVKVTMDVVLSLALLLAIAAVVTVHLVR